MQLTFPARRAYFPDDAVNSWSLLFSLNVPVCKYFCLRQTQTGDFSTNGIRGNRTHVCIELTHFLRTLRESGLKILNKTLFASMPLE